jgi:hypothetical protein
MRPCDRSGTYRISELPQDSFTKAYSHYTIFVQNCRMQPAYNLRRFISSCSGNENLLKLPRGEVYDMLIVKTGKKLGSPNSFRRYDKRNICHVFPPYGAIFNKDPTKNVYLVIIYKKTWYFSESKIIDVHCRGAKMSFPILSDMRCEMIFSNMTCKTYRGTKI